MTAALKNRRILTPRGGPWGFSAATLCAQRGAIGVIAPLIEARQPLDTAALAASISSLEPGEYSWVTYHSVAIELAEQLDVIPQNTLFASIGPGTARQAERLGLRCGAVAATQTVEGLLDSVDQYFANPKDESTSLD